jgi:hypothetical protein
MKRQKNPRHLSDEDYFYISEESLYFTGRIVKLYSLSA